MYNICFSLTYFTLCDTDVPLLLSNSILNIVSHRKSVLLSLLEIVRAPLNCLRTPPLPVLWWEDILLKEISVHTLHGQGKAWLWHDGHSGPCWESGLPEWRKATMRSNTNRGFPSPSCASPGPPLRVSADPASCYTRPASSPPLDPLSGDSSGTPLQYSCLENPMDGGAWWAAVHGVAKSRTQLNDFTFIFSLSCIGEGNVSPLQCSCLENPRDGGAWWAAVYGVAQSRTRLKWLSNSRPLEHKWDMVTPLQWIEYWESHEMMRWARSLSRSLSPSLLHLSPTFPRRAASYRVVSFPMERTEVSGQQPLEWLWKGIHPQCGLEIRPQSWPAPREAACKGLWARSTQLSHIWVLDPQKLWVNKCPLF